VGGWIFNKFNLPIFDGIAGDIAQGLIGALVILFVFGLIKKK